MANRPTIEVPTPPGGWGAPWPNVAELEAVFPHEKWTLVGGLMAQLHGPRRGMDVIRPTNDVDIVLHLETSRGVAAQAAGALESLGYQFVAPIDDHRSTAHRFARGEASVDVVTGAPGVIDVLAAEHAALLLAVIEDPYLERNRFSGSDRSRLRTLAKVLPDDARFWRLLPSEWRISGQAALRILTA